MFEGEGTQVNTNKYVPIKKRFVDGLFVVASNEMPDIENSKHNYNKSQWSPMESRMNLVTLYESHDGKTEFPYSAFDLACALKHLVEHPKFSFPKVVKNDNMGEALDGIFYNRKKTEW